MITRAEAGQADLALIKEHLRIAFVMEEYGFEPVVADHRSLNYHSPFRDDENPSFDVFYHTINNRVDPEERWGDRGEAGPKGTQGTQGDVVDLIQRFDGSTRGVALSKARELLQTMIDSDWSGPTITTTEKKVLSLSDIKVLSDLGRPLSLSPLTWESTLSTRPGLADASLPGGRVFLHPEHDTIVFLTADEHGDIKGARFRGDDGSKWTQSGSANILLRLDNPKDAPVFLTEGETDTWAAWSVLGDEYEVLGAPGVGNPPSTLGGEYLAGRTVYIAFDPDDAGLGARDQWTTYLIGIGCEVRVVVLPTGRDLAGLYAAEIAQLPNRARHVPPPPDGFVRQGVQFGVSSVSKQGEPSFSEKTNWSFEPTSILIGEGGERSYSGRLLPHNVVTTLPAAALTSASGLRSWGAPHQCRWYGSDQMVQQLAALLDHEAALLPEGRVTDQVGLYEGCFVWGEGCIGTSDVHYVEGEASPGYGPKNILIEGGETNPIEVFEAFYNSQDPGATGPMLAWQAAAPLRPRFQRFPILSVTGMSGAGKSTWTEAACRALSATNITTNLTSTTSYGVEVMMDTTNAFPLWFDEYRPGARDDALTRLNQLIRDAYTGQESRKGGAETNRSRLRAIRTMAPIIIVGEDDFTETSHTDRMVLIRLDASRKGDLDPVLQVTGGQFAHMYLTFLTQSASHVEEPPVLSEPVLLPSGIEGLRARQEENLRVLQYGWRLLTAFLQSYDPGYRMPELDLSLVAEAGQEAGRTSPVLELVLISLENDTQHPTVWEQDGEIMVSTTNLIREARNHPSIILPTTTGKGLAAILTTQEFGGEHRRVRVPPAVSGVLNKQMRVVVIPRSVVHLTDTDDED